MTSPLVYVIDDDPSVRKALARLLQAAGFGVETFASAGEFLSQPPPDGPACVILDVEMPGLGGLDLQQALAGREPGLPIVFITGHGTIPMTVQALKAGAIDFLPKPFRDEDLLAAIRHALTLQARGRQAAADVADLRRRAEAVSPREREVMTLVVRGLLNKQVGCQLGVTERTVKAHRAQVMGKMRAASLADLVRMAEKIDLRPPQP